MNNLSSEQWISWKKKRRNNVIAYLILMFISGVDDTVVLSTLYLYLDTVVETEYPDIYYGIIIGAFSFSSIVFGIIAGRCLDKTRNIKLYTNIVMILQIIGNLLYGIPYSVAFPLIGRFIAGFGDTLQSVYSGEVVRLYEVEESISVLWWITSSFSIGLILGPTFSIIFKNVQFSIGTLQINYLNIIGIFMASMLLITLIITNFLLSDCSKEFDYKEYLEEKKANENSTSNYANESYQTSCGIEGPEIQRVPEDTEQSLLLDTISTSAYSPISIRTVLKVIWKFPDMKLMFLSSFIFSITLFGSDYLTPLISYQMMHWDIVAVTIIFVAHGIFYFLLLIGLSRFCTTDKAIYNMCIICSVFQVIDLCILIFMKELKRNFRQDVVLMTLFEICFTPIWLIQEVLLKGIVAKMVPSEVQGFVESLRFSLCKISGLVVSFTTALALRYLQWWSAIMICSVIYILFCLVMRKKRLTNIEVIPFSDYGNKVVVDMVKKQHSYYTTNV